MRSYSKLLASLPLALAVVAAPAHAEVIDEHVDPQHSVSLTFSPFHLILPMFELQAEFKVSPKVGLAGILGIGGVSVTTNDSKSSFLVYELGAKFAYDAVGDFEEGLQLGLEVLYVGLSGSDQGDFEGGSVVARGVSVSPLIGYKIIADIGFTFEVQAGPAFIFATASNSSGDKASAVGIRPNLNLNVGWSF